LEFQAAAKLLIDALLMGMVIILMPYLLIVIAIAIFAELIQTGPLLAFKALIPKGDKLNPVSNLKQMFSMKNIIEFVKSILKVIFLTILIYIVIRDSIAPLLFLPSKSIATAGVALGSMLKDMAIYSFIGFFAIALRTLPHIYTCTSAQEKTRELTLIAALAAQHQTACAFSMHCPNCAKYWCVAFVGTTYLTRLSWLSRFRSIIPFLRKAFRRRCAVVVEISGSITMASSTVIGLSSCHADAKTLSIRDSTASSCGKLGKLRTACTRLRYLVYICEKLATFVFDMIDFQRLKYDFLLKHFSSTSEIQQYSRKK
jgi:hypothetical protein